MFKVRGLHTAKVINITLGWWVFPLFTLLASFELNNTVANKPYPRACIGRLKEPVELLDKVKEERSSHDLLTTAKWTMQKQINGHWQMSTRKGLACEQVVQVYDGWTMEKHFSLVQPLPMESLPAG